MKQSAVEEKTKERERDNWYSQLLGDVKSL
jgi:hypothetical protein